MATLQPGDPAPAFALLDQDGNTVRLADFQGKKVLLFFYPKAMTSGCTKQACSVRDARTDLAALGVVALGISPDPVALQKKFDAKHSLGFPLLSDPDHAVATAYGVWGEKSMYGKKYEGISRSAFLIDEQGQLLQAFYKISPEQTVPKVQAALTQAA
ncbi:MAG: thioredoxin-dependent thiol peroxidase [Desulfobacca sp.]|uniref:thioredoxin-dependent thiol peroxidase n=1 Tax=Desulfobacca sp. TaxID=2067990 RepID=UPI00404A86E0